MVKRAMMVRDQQDIQAKGRAAEAGLLDAFIDEMSRVADDDSLLFRLASGVAPKPPEQPEEPQE